MSQMKQYHDLIEFILLNGKDILNTRTGSICKTIIGCQMTFDMSEGFPVLTTRKLPFKGIRGELLGFFRGYTSATDFRALGCKFWDGNANETKAWLDNFYRKGEDDCGNIYGKQWTNWEVIRISESQEESKHLSKPGSEWEFLGSTDYNHSTGSGFDIYRKYINQLENVVRTIITNPSDRRLIVSGWNIGEFDRMSLPPCFTEDALVTMKHGYRRIAYIKEGDEVLSGSGVLRKVNKVFKTRYKGEMIYIKPKYIAEPIKCTPNHPFLVKDKGWVEAQYLKDDDILCVKKPEFEKNLSFCYFIGNSYKKDIFKEYDLTIDDYFTMGYFVGNGWVNLRKNEVTFSIPHKKKDYILEKIRKTIKVSELKNTGVNVSKYSTKSVKWCRMFLDFGHGAANKYLPDWLFKSSKEAINAFIEGYCEADGYEKPSGAKIITTVSCMLAYGIQRLCTINNIMATVQFQERPKTAIIEGRTVNQRNTYSVTITKKNFFSSYDDDFMYVPISEIRYYEDELYVYNLDVEEDHTYNVNNIVNHNCHIQYNFIPLEQDKTISVVMTIRSMDVFLGTPANIASTAIFLAVVGRLTGYTPDKVIIQGANAHLYENSFEVAKELITREHYPAPKLVLSDNIKEIKNLEDIKGCFSRIEPEDITLEGYSSHPVLTVPMIA